MVEPILLDENLTNDNWGAHVNSNCTIGLDGSRTGLIKDFTALPGEYCRPDEGAKLTSGYSENNLF